MPDHIYTLGHKWPDAQDKSKLKDLLGGKGLSLFRMSEAGIPVPPAIVISTEFHRKIMKDGANIEAAVEGILPDVLASLSDMSKAMGHTPLLSVRSGAPVSLPGMCDTILNVGLRPGNRAEWDKRIGKKSAADCSRRLVHMLGTTAFGLDSSKFEDILSSAKTAAGVHSDSELSIEDMLVVEEKYIALFEASMPLNFFETTERQLSSAIYAVIKSWMNPRAIEYRKLNNIPSDMGTAVTIQAMVFGNTGPLSGTGVLFSRDPSTGLPGMMGEFLVDAQGEDVVAGVRTPLPITDMPLTKPTIVGKKERTLHNPHKYDPATRWADIYASLKDVCAKLETVYVDMVDVEFTVEQGNLHILQSRVGKRSAGAAVKIAYDLVGEGKLTQSEAVKRVTVAQYKALGRPSVSPEFKTPPTMTGLPACPGIARGNACFSSEYLCQLAAINPFEEYILVTKETDPDDIGGMIRAAGILTATGGVTSHAAVVARAMNKPCVTGCSDLIIAGKAATITGNATEFKEGSEITIDGDTGRAWVGISVPVVDPVDSVELIALREWCVTQSGFVESRNLPPDVHPCRTTTITMADTWGDSDALEIILEDIASMGVPEDVTLDTRTPKSLRHKDDAALLTMFGTEDNEANELAALVNRLAMRTDLEGLRVLFTEKEQGLSKLLGECGYVVLRPPANVNDLFCAGYIPPNQSFIDTVIGGNTAWLKLKTILQQSNYFEAAQSRPLDYIVYHVLGQNQ